jgi:hypothetical protein
MGIVAYWRNNSAGRSTTPDDQSFLNPRGRLFGTAFVLKVHDKAQRTTTGTADLGTELTMAYRFWAIPTKPLAPGDLRESPLI